MDRTRRQPPGKRLPSAGIYLGRPPRLRPLLTITASDRRRSVLEAHSSLVNDLGRDPQLRFDAVPMVPGWRLEPGVESVAVPRRAIPICPGLSSDGSVSTLESGLCASLVPY